MSEVEKQEGQKTVVAFIAGLLIGGLLVWVFSSSPEQTPMVEQSDDTDTEEVVSDDTDSESSDTEMDDTDTEPTEATEVAERGDAAISVSDQPAGSVVVLDSTTYPSAAGWIAVRDYMDGIAGNVLGAARYNEADGLLPTEVELQRATEAGNTYQVVYYTENGDKMFDLTDDVVIEGIMTFFTAE